MQICKRIKVHLLMLQATNISCRSQTLTVNFMECSLSRNKMISHENDIRKKFTNAEIEACVYVWCV